MKKTLIPWIHPYLLVLPLTIDQHSLQTREEFLNIVQFLII